MIDFPIPLGTVVYLIALHFGLSAGWQFGRGYTFAVKLLPDFKKAFSTLIMEGTTEYVAAMLIVTISATIMASANPEIVFWIAVFGFGIGMAYDDRANHPPENMLTYMIERFRSHKKEIDDME